MKCTGDHSFIEACSSDYGFAGDLFKDWGTRTDLLRERFSIEKILTVASNHKIHESLPFFYGDLHIAEMHRGMNNFHISLFFSTHFMVVPLWSLVTPGPSTPDLRKTIILMTKQRSSSYFSSASSTIQANDLDFWPSALDFFDSSSIFGSMVVFHTLLKT